MLNGFQLLIAEVRDPGVRLGKVAEETTAAISANQEPENCHSFIYRIAADSNRPHGVGG